ECDQSMIDSTAKSPNDLRTFPDNVDMDLDSISIVSSVKRQPSNDIFTIKNYDSLLKELISLVAQFINLPDKSSANQHIIEKASVYLFWVFYDASNLNNLLNQHVTVGSSINMANLSSNYSNL